MTKDCPNCIAVRESLAELQKSQSFGMYGSMVTIKCKQGHLVFGDD